MRGGPSTDDLWGGPGADSIDGGGGGGDTVSYQDHRGPVTVDLSRPGVPAGAAGEGDMLKGIGGVIGTDGPDRITAAPTGTTVEGEGGDDVIRGGPGSDNLQGGRGDDRIHGGGGGDFIDAGRGRDLVDAGAGDDFVVPGVPDDEHGRIDCGSGSDDIGASPNPYDGTWQPGDAIHLDCELVELPLSVPTIFNRHDPRPLRSLRLRMWCDTRTQPCRVRIALRWRGEVVGSAVRDVPARGATNATVPLDQTARERLAAAGKLRLRVGVNVRYGRRLAHHEAAHYALIVR